MPKTSLARQRSWLRRSALALMLSCTGAIVLPSSFAHAGQGATLTRIAVVDVQRVLLETAEGKRELKKIESSFKRTDARLNKKAQQLEEDYKDLQSKAAMLNEAELQKRQQKLIANQQELQRLAMEAQQDVMEKEAVATDRIYKKVQSLVKKLADEETIEVVLVKSEMTVLYTNPKLDITNRLIVRYDQEHP